MNVCVGVCLSTIAALAPATTRAQSPIVQTGPAVEIAGLLAESVTQPRWSPDPSLRLIAFTFENYKGLWTKDLDTGGVKNLTEEPGAGFGFEWSPDGSAIAARVSRYEGLRRFDAIKVFEKETGEFRQLTQFSGRIRTIPTWTEGGESVVLGGKSPSKLTYPARGAKTVSATTSALVTDGSFLRLVDDGPGPGRVLTRLDNTVLNLVVSADRSMIAFEVLGGDLYVASSDGSMMTSLGPGNRPSWSPDGRWVVFARTRDDGHRFTESDLFIGTRSGAVWQLTDTPDILEMNPSWSPRGDEIVFDHDGRIYVLPVEVRR